MAPDVLRESLSEKLWSESGVSSGRAFDLTAVMSQDQFLEGGAWSSVTGIGKRKGKHHALKIYSLIIQLNLY